MSESSSHRLDFAMKTERISGIFTPNVVPLRTDGSIHEDELRRYVRWLIAQGVHGLYPNGSTGEFIRFSSEERRRITKIVCEESAGKAVVLAGAWEPTLRATIETCAAYADYGVRAAAVLSPFYFKLSQESIETYFRELARQTPLDLIMYNIPMMASPMEVATIRRLAELDRIIGIKDSSGDTIFMLEMQNAVRPIRPDFSLLTGWDPLLASLLAQGVDGGTNALAGVAPAAMRRVYDLSRSGQWTEAFALQRRLTALFEKCIRAFDFPEGFRAAVEVAGFEIGVGRMPLSANQMNQRRELQAVIQRMLAELS